MIKKLFRSLAYRLLKWSKIYQDIDLLIQSNLKDFHHVASYHSAVFYPGSRVSNLQNIQNKIVIGDGTFIAGELIVLKYGGQIRIGENCYIGDHSRIWSGESIQIGDNVLISHNVNIMDTNSHEIDALERAEGFKKQQKIGYSSEKGSVKTKPIVIKNHAWIGLNSIILKGVTIGEGAIIGAGSVVTRDVPDYVIIAGNPAQIVGNLKTS